MNDIFLMKKHILVPILNSSSAISKFEKLQQFQRGLWSSDFLPFASINNPILPQQFHPPVSYPQAFSGKKILQSKPDKEPKIPAYPCARRWAAATNVIVALC